MKPKTNISNNTFTGIHWDAKAVDSITKVAEGLRLNAEALSKLASLFHAQDIHIDTLLRVE